MYTSKFYVTIFMWRVLFARVPRGKLLGFYVANAFAESASCFV